MERPVLLDSHRGIQPRPEIRPLGSTRKAGHTSKSLEGMDYCSAVDPGVGVAGGLCVKDGEMSSVKSELVKRLALHCGL